MTMKFDFTAADESHRFLISSEAFRRTQVTASLREDLDLFKGNFIHRDYLPALFGSGNRSATSNLHVEVLSKP
jgi:hypothetical protein